MVDKHWSGARFAHPAGVGCGVAGCGTGQPTLGMHRVGAAIPPPFPNPRGGTTWYHGTSFDPDEANEQEEEAYPGGTVRAPERYDTGEYGDNVEHHWNTDLGAHFTSMHDVAHTFATGGRYSAYSKNPAHIDSRILHAGLHMANPAHYENERDLGKHAITWAHEQGGFRFLPHSNEAHGAFLRGDHDEIGGQHDYTYLDDHVMDQEHRAAISGIDRNGVEDHHSLHHVDNYLRMHPMREEIVNGFQRHLKEQGHDGIIYGNDYEGPKGHACAIAFHDTPVHHRRWQWLHESQQHMNGTPEQRIEHEPTQVPWGQVSLHLGAKDLAPGKTGCWRCSGRGEIQAGLDFSVHPPKSVLGPCTHCDGSGQVEHATYPKAEVPKEQEDLLERREGESYDAPVRRALNYVRDPKPGTVMWRGEIRHKDDIANPPSVGMHWTINPNHAIIGSEVPKDHVPVLWEARLDHPQSQAIPRSHPVWGGRFRSMDSEAEIRLHPETHVHVTRAIHWTGDGEPGGMPWPSHPERTDGRWQETRVDKPVEVRHRSTSGLMDYSQVGLKTGSKGFFKRASQDLSGHREHWEPGSRPFYEYHCLESPESADAQAWYHSHRPVTVLRRNVEDEQTNGTVGLSFDERASEGAPATYQVRHDDGFEHTAFEDELHTHPMHFTRPDPPGGRTQASAQPLYRGISVMVPGHELVDAHERGGMAGVHQHLIDAIGTHTARHWEHNLKESTGLGTHWTSDLNVARKFSGGMFGSHHDPNPKTHVDSYSDVRVPVVIHGHVDPQHHVTDPDALDMGLVQGYGWTGLDDTPEHETMVRRGAPVRVSHIEASLPTAPNWLHQVRKNIDSFGESGSLANHQHAWQQIHGAMQHTAAKDCPCCGGAGEHSCGHECYACDASGQHEGSAPCEGHLGRPDTATVAENGCDYGARPENGMQHTALTLYRGEGDHTKPSYYPATGPDALAGAWWTDDAEKAANYARSAKGQVYALDVEEHEAEPRGARGNYVVKDPEVRARRRLHTAHVLDQWQPTERLFAPTKGGVDPRLFGPDKQMLPNVRLAILAKVHDFFEFIGYGDTTGWARVYLAGSQASEWYGNNDFDILVGIEYAAFRRAHPDLAGLSVVDIDARINDQFRKGFNDEGWHPPFDPEHEWHLTGYVNKNSWDIAEIKPYAAYDVTDDRWAVEPIDEPTGHQFGPTEWYYFEGVAAQVRNALALPEPLRTQRCTQIWTFVHTDRSRAFGPHGSGAFDRGNALEKYLDQAPSGIEGVSLMGALQAARFGTKTAAAQEYFHGTRHTLRNGQILEGGTAKANQGYGQPAGHVYYSGRHDVASYFAEAGYGPEGDIDAPPRVYKVEPLDDHEVDPDEDREWQSFRSKRVRVLHQVPYSYPHHLGAKTAAASPNAEAAMRFALTDHFWTHHPHLDHNDPQADLKHRIEHQLRGDSAFQGKGQDALGAHEHDPLIDPSVARRVRLDAFTGTRSTSDWMEFDDLPEEAKNSVRHMRPNTHSPEEMEARGRRSQWQIEHVPTEEMKRRVMTSDPDLGNYGDGTFEGYHRWYLDAGTAVPDHGTSRWPVIEHHPDDDTEGYLDDGWHRLHSYIRAGDTHIPLLRQRPKPRGMHAQAGLDDDDYRMSHRPPGRDGTPIHDMTHNFPEDIYTHPHYYSDMSERTNVEAHNVINRVRNKPDAKVHIYRALPAEFAHQGFRPGDWVSTSKEYARNHGVHHTDPKQDWPVIHTVVRADDLHTDGDDFREFGYNGTETRPGNVAFKGGYHQEVSDRADGGVRKVVRRGNSPVKDFMVSHDPSSYDDAMAGRGGITARDPEGNYAGHIRYDGDGVFSHNIEPQHAEVAEHLDKKMRSLLPKEHR